MSLSRRNFLRSAAIGTAAASLEFPLAQLGSPEPRRTGRPGGPILLNSNEDAYGALPSVQAVMKHALAEANRYPFREYDGLTERIAAYNQLQPEQVLTGCGSTEILRIAAQAFLENGK